MLPPTLLGILQELHSQYKSLKDGVVANYIPAKKQEAGDNVETFHGKSLQG